ncbi:MAG TPA: glycosyl hydrolase family 8 [Polyangiaceae bacterium]
MPRAIRFAFAASVLAGCGTTLDSLGYNDIRDGGLEVEADTGIVLHPLTGPSSYPNAFVTVLGKTDTDITNKIATTFASLFHGDPATQAIYFEVGNDQAYIRDTLHGDIRTEGMGYGMIIAVELNKRDEFDRIWRYAKNVAQYVSGSNAGYFRSDCDTVTGTTPCVDPFGLQQFTMALIFAHDRWGSTTTIDYASEAIALLEVMRNKEAQNGGVVDGVTNSFDATTQLVFDVPSTSAAGVSRPSIEMPAYYELWAQATGDAFWKDAAAAGRAYWQKTANATTGFMPTRATFDGTPVAGYDVFEPEGYRTQLNMVLDRIFGGSDTWAIDESNRLLTFFATQGIDQYGNVYSLDGLTEIGILHDDSLVAVNGATALVATADTRFDFIDAAWNVSVPTMAPRYYSGLLDLLMLLILSGQYRVY